MIVNCDSCNKHVKECGRLRKTAVNIGEIGNVRLCRPCRIKWRGDLLV